MKIFSKYFKVGMVLCVMALTLYSCKKKEHNVYSFAGTHHAIDAQSVQYDIHTVYPIPHPSKDKYVGQGDITIVVNSAESITVNGGQTLLRSSEYSTDESDVYVCKFDSLDVHSYSFITFMKNEHVIYWDMEDLLHKKTTTAAGADTAYDYYSITTVLSE